MNETDAKQIYLKDYNDVVLNYYTTIQINS